MHGAAVVEKSLTSAGSRKPKAVRLCAFASQIITQSHPAFGSAAAGVRPINEDENKESLTTNLFITFHRCYGVTSLPNSSCKHCTIPMESAGYIAFGDGSFPQPDSRHSV